MKIQEIILQLQNAECIHDQCNDEVEICERKQREILDRLPKSIARLKEAEIDRDKMRRQLIHTLQTELR